MSVRIGIDFRAAIAHPCGIARYARELARGLLDLREDVELVLYAATRYGSIVDRIPRAIREHPRAQIIERRLPAKALRALSFLPGFSLKSITGPLALIHHTDLTYLPHDGIPEVVTVHDLAYEVSSDFHGEDFRSTVGARVRRAVHRARLIVVPSEVTKRDLISRYDVDESIIRVIHHGVDHVTRRIEDTDQSGELLLAPSLLEQPYLLHVGTIEPRKNLVRVLKAYQRARSRGAEVNLVLAGPRGWKTEAFERELERHPYRSSIHELGAVPEAALRDLYEHADVVVYPSLYEGFGLPVVEAMAHGVPVITSNRSSTEEVARDAALLVDPEDVVDIANGIEKLLGDEEYRRQIGRKGLERTSGLTWKNTAYKTFQVYREILGGSVELPKVHTATA